jgi:hypothetical protein
MDYKFLASRQAFELAGKDYADYIERATQEHIDKGVYSLEYALTATLGERLAGNDGE